MEARKTIGRYEIRDSIGRGGMGALFRAHDPVLDRDVAIKTMLADFIRDEDGRTRFYREARAAARLQHRNIVTLFDFGEDEGTLYIVMEFLVGQTVAEYIRGGAKFSIDRVLEIGSQLCTGLHFAHVRGVIHRDIKPPNIWLNEDGGVKLLDFGIAKFGDTTVTRIGGVVGSVSYMSPEQVSGEVDLDGRSDIFAVGTVLYELLSGQRPFRAETPTGIMMKIVREPPPPLDVPGVPPQLVAVIGRALEKDRAKRYQYANEMAAELRGLQAVVRSQSSGHSSGTGRLATTVPILVPSIGVESPGGREASAPNLAPSPAPIPPGQTLSPPPSRTERALGTPAPPPSRTERALGTPAGAPAATPAEFVASDAHDLTGGDFSWSPGSAEDLVGEAVITPSSQFAAIDARAKALSESTWTGRTAAVWLTRWPGLAIAGGAVAIAAFAFVLLMRAESTGAGSVEKPTAASVAAPSASAGATTPGTPAGAKTPVALEPGGSPKPAPPPPVETDVHVVLSGPYAFSVLDESGRVISGPYSKHDLRLAPKQVLHLQAKQVYLDQRVIVEDKPGGTMHMQAPAVGTLVVWSQRETCFIFLNNTNLSNPPIRQNVAAGKYRLTQNCGDGEQNTEVVAITPGKTTEIKFFQ